MLILTYLLCVIITNWYLHEPESRREVNLNPAIDEWNAREIEEESESLYE